MELQRDVNHPNRLVASANKVSPRKTVFLDVFGNDADAEPGNADKPFRSFEAAFAATSVAPNYKLAIGPGSFEIPAGWGIGETEIVGWGRRATTLKVTGLAANGEQLRIFRGNAVGSRIADLTIDCGGFAGMPDNQAVTAIDFYGDLASVENVDIVGLYCTGRAQESWGIAAQNITGCRVINAVNGRGGFSAFQVRERGNALRCVADFRAATDCAYANGFTPGGSHVTFLECAALGCTSGVYIDTVPDGVTMDDIAVHASLFERMQRNGAAIRIRPVNQPGDRVRAVMFRGNRIFLEEEDVVAEFNTVMPETPNKGEISRFTIKGNDVFTNDNARAFSVIDGATDGEIRENTVFGNFLEEPFQHTNTVNVRVLQDIAL